MFFILLGRFARTGSRLFISKYCLTYPLACDILLVEYVSIKEIKTLMKENVQIVPASVNSFVGDIVAVKLVADSDISKEKITWSASGDAVIIKSFADDERYAFSYGVLLTLCKVGEVTVTANFDGTEYSIPVTVREMKHTEPSTDLNYYIGDLHDHTSLNHDPKLFPTRAEDHAREYLKQVKEEGLIDFTVISDHAELLKPNEFFDNFFAADEVSPQIVIFPGCESAVSAMATDRYGITIKQSGEIVTLNTDDYTDCATWEEFYSKVARKPFALCTLAHPQIIGYSHKGMWNFMLHQNNTPEMRHAIHTVEMGNGTTRESNLINEFMYSVALDNGFKVSTTCSSDSHGPVWGYHGFPGKTVIMAENRTKEDFIDAIMSCRIYASESGNVKLAYTVNGVCAPAVLTPCDKYEFNVKVSLFHEDADALPVECKVISNRGKTVKTITGEALSDFSFTVNSDEAEYFYLRLRDSKNRKTWSVPVFTGRATENKPISSLAPIDKSGFSATDVKYATDANLLVSDDPNESWHSDHSDAEIVIDMGRIEKITALGHYPRIITRELLKEISKRPEALIAELPVEYTLQTSVDGVKYCLCDTGLFRVFGGEEIIEFKETSARYVKLSIHSNVAEYSGHKKSFREGLAMGELTLYKKQ